MTLLCSCSGPGQEDPRSYFLLDAQRGGIKEPAKNPIILTVRPFLLSPGFDKHELVYRTGVSKYETDYYNRFVTDVGSQVSEQTRKWLSQSGLFGQVLPLGTSADATHLLEGNISKLYGDFRSNTDGEAVMEMEFFFVDVRMRKPIVVLSGTFDSRRKILDSKAESIVAAYDSCLGQILSELEAELGQFDELLAESSQ
jgi:uncharacterized lipoprotein YmbA